MKAVSKIVKNEEEVKPIEFPCLMQSKESGAVALFMSQKERTVLFMEGISPFSQQMEEWSHASEFPWEPFKGEIVLRNE